MAHTLAWVVGRGGLLGSHLTRQLADQLPTAACWECLVPRFSWNDPALLAVELRQAVRAFAQEVRRKYDRWMVLWAAGAGVIGSSPAVLGAETARWKLFLHLLGRQLVAQRLPSHGLIFLASSAGSVYGDCPAYPLTEAAACAPTSAYGHHKLLQERLLRAWVQSHPAIDFLIGRIANLYGPEQNLAKRQGLISHVSRCLIHDRPIHLYVPLDTIRDYLLSDDCAAHIVRCLVHMASVPGRDRGVLKLFASEQETSIAEILGMFSRIAPRPPRVIYTPIAGSRQHSRRLCFRSTVWRSLGLARSVGIQLGIERVHRHHLALFRQGHLPVA